MNIPVKRYLFLYFLLAFLCSDSYQKALRGKNSLIETNRNDDADASNKEHFSSSTLLNEQDTEEYITKHSSSATEPSETNTLPASITESTTTQSYYPTEPTTTPASTSESTTTESSSPTEPITIPSKSTTECTCTQSSSPTEPITTPSASKEQLRKALLQQKRQFLQYLQLIQHLQMKNHQRVQRLLLQAQQINARFFPAKPIITPSASTTESTTTQSPSPTSDSMTPPETSTPTVSTPESTTTQSSSISESTPTTVTPHSQRAHSQVLELKRQQ